jgi:P27 family predicted phage terminase small subunit
VAEPKRRPPLHVVRSGNPGHEAAEATEAKRGLQLPSSAPAEPDWREWFPAASRAPRGEAPAAKAARTKAAAALTRCRAVARAEWRRVVPLLDQTGMLASVDRAVLVDLCVCSARIDECERMLSAEGLMVAERRHGATMIAGRYRDQLKWLVGELGLSPASRQRLSGTPAGASSGPTSGDGTYDV